MTRIIAAILLLAGVVRAADTNTYRGIVLAPGSTIPIVYSVTQTGQVNKLTVDAADYRGDLIITGAAGVVSASGSTITITEQNTGLSAANLTAGTVATAIDGSAITNLNASNLASGTVPDARIDSAITRDAEAAAAYQPTNANLSTLALNDGGSLTNLDLTAYPIEDLSNVDSVAAPTTDDVLKWNGAAWSNAAAAVGTTLTYTGAVSGALILTNADSTITITQTDKSFSIAASASGDDFIWIPASEWSLSIANPMGVGTTTNEYGKIVNIRNADRATAEEAPIEFMKAATASTNIDLIVEGYSAAGTTGIVYFTAQEDGKSIVTSGAYNVSAISITNKGTYIWDNAFGTSITNYSPVSFQFGLATTNQGTVLGGDFSFSGLTIRQQP